LAVLGVVLSTVAITLEAITLASRLAPHYSAVGAAVPVGPGTEDSPPPPLDAPSETPPPAAADIDGDPATVLASPLLASSLLDAAEDRMLGPHSVADDFAAAVPTSLEPLLAAEPHRVAASGAWLGDADGSPGADDAEGTPGSLSAISGRGGKRGGQSGGGAGRGKFGSGGENDGGASDGDGIAGGVADGGGGGGDRPNLVLLIADDAGMGDINAFRAASGGAAARAPPHLAVGGAPHGLTPNLDAMARKGVRCA
jgi:hypothetical protein